MLAVRDTRVDDKDHLLYLLGAKFKKKYISTAILLNVYGNSLYAAYFVLEEREVTAFLWNVADSQEEWNALGIL